MIVKTPLSTLDISDLVSYAKLSQSDRALEMAFNHAVDKVEDITGFALRDLEVEIRTTYRNIVLPFVPVNENVDFSLEIEGESVDFDDYFEIFGAVLMTKCNSIYTPIKLVYQANAVQNDALLLLAYRLATYFYDNRTTAIPSELVNELRGFKRWEI